MKKRIGRKSDNGNLLPLSEGDLTAKKSRPRPPKHARKGGSSRWGLKIILPVVVGLALFIVIFLHYSESDTAVKVKSRLNPLKEYLENRVSEVRKKRKHRKKQKTAEDAEMHKHRLEKAEKRLDEEKHDRAEAIDQKHDELLKKKQEGLPLYNFESLRYAFLHSELVLLYFAASWCPMSSPVTEQLDSLFREILVAPPVDSKENGEAESSNAMERLLNTQQGVALVYVSSDQSEEEMEDYMEENWMVVPYDSPDRNNLKRHFKTCAKNEVEALGMESRDREIPSLIVLASSTHEVITYDGVQDIKDRGQQAVDKWLEHLTKTE